MNGHQLVYRSILNFFNGKFATKNKEMAKVKSTVVFQREKWMTEGNNAGGDYVGKQYVVVHTFSIQILN